MHQRRLEKALEMLGSKDSLKTAKNPTKKHITGVATYNVFPLKAGKCPSLRQ